MNFLSDRDRNQVSLSISEDTLREVALLDSGETFFELSSDLFCIVDIDGYFKRVNSTFQQVLGYSAAELVDLSWLSSVHPEDRATTFLEIEKLKQGFTSVKFKNRYLCRDGSYRRLNWTAVAKGRNSIYAVAKDITICHHLQQQLSWKSKYDCLTKLLNRGKFEQKISQIIAYGSFQHKFYTFCYLDLDRFQLINDLCGHGIGDELLCLIASLLKQKISQEDFLYRLGGDEFGIILTDSSLAEAEIIAHQIKQSIQDFCFDWQVHNFVLTASISVVAIDNHISDFSNLLNVATAACCAAKKQGRNLVRVYSPQDQELAKQRDEKAWITKLHLALEQNLFCLYCQKITPLKDNYGSDHYEILLRLADKKGNLVSPMEFIPAAEQYDLMPSIDRWVISTFFASYHNYCQLQKDNSFKNIIYTINLSGDSINSDYFFDFLKEQLIAHQIPPQNICFEITETVTITNLQKAAKFIRDLKQLGCLFALDDFGSGMSSFNYLKHLPVDYLKIDGNFVKNIVNDPVDRATVECFNRISTAMNIQTIAEFVENDEIMSQLKEIGIDYAQGYGIDKPAPLFF